mmetsp:Transcript_9150/g.21967  ORF Transcript_9150/g.21967 Transcript_9150/m.21967 type:complete len:101 (-) Transcript_9150:113-415(-)
MEANIEHLRSSSEIASAEDAVRCHCSEATVPLLLCREACSAALCFGGRCRAVPGDVKAWKLRPWPPYPFCTEGRPDPSSTLERKWQLVSAVAIEHGGSRL